MSALREAFEAWAVAEAPPMTPYERMCAWEAWQKRAAITQQQRMPSAPQAAEPQDPDPRGKALRDLLDFWHGGHLTVRSEAGGAWEAAVQAGEQAMLTADPHKEHWTAIAKAAEAIAASPHCTPAQADQFCQAIDRLSAAIMGDSE